MEIRPAYSYSNIALSPNYSEVLSRRGLNTNVDFLGWRFRNPVVPANMACTSSFEKAEELSANGYFYILHRFYDYAAILAWIKKSAAKLISISIGVQKEDLDLLKKICREGLLCDFVTIDVAHGHNLNVRNMCWHFHELPWRKKPKLIVGNIGTPQGVLDVTDWGADCAKLGIAHGHACFQAGTLVSTNKGFCKIEDLKEGDFVLTHKSQYKKIVKTIKNSLQQKTLKVNGVTCTEDHKFFVLKKTDLGVARSEEDVLRLGVFMKAKDLNKEKYLIITN